MTSVNVSINGKSFSASKSTGKFEKGAITTSANEDECLTKEEYEKLRYLFDSLEDYVED